MSKFELSVSPNYVSDWGISEAIRELFQNAIDQEALSEYNKMFFSYNEEEQSISIGNKESILTPESLLLGTSTKSDNDDTIGKFGEGYKIATLVLLRNNKRITFYNYGKKEVWYPRFVKSRRYGGVNILTFEVKKNHFWDKVPDNNLNIVINGITKEEYDIIKNTNLHLQEINEDDVVETSYGKILLNDKYNGQFFVNGLYVATKSIFKYGYDIIPKYMQLDRDRKLLEIYEMSSLTSKMWGESVLYEKIHSMFESNNMDVHNLYSWYTNSDFKIIMLKKFKEKYGENAIPIGSTHEIEALCSSYKPIIVSSAYRDVLITSKEYIEPKQKPSIKELLIDWSIKNQEAMQECLPQEELDEFLRIIELL